MTIIAAVSLVALITSASLAVDVGNVYLAKRRLQGAADAAAMYAAAAVVDRTAAARTALADNGLITVASIEVTPGSYVPNAQIAETDRFTPGSSSSNSARVKVEQDVPIFFVGILTRSDKMRIVATATAAKIDYAAFSIGSRLTSVQGGLPNAILSGLAGTNLNLTVMDYNALAQTDVNLLAFTKALQVQLGLSGATFGDTLATRITLPQALAALAAASGNQQASASLARLQALVPGKTVRLADLIDLGPFADTDRSDPTAIISSDAYSIVQQILQLANGDRQVVSDLGINVPGITSTNLTVAVGQRPTRSPWLTVAKDGSVVVRTAQARLYLDSQVGGAKLGLVSVRLPIYIELAEAAARLKSVSCQGGRSSTAVALEVQPSLGKAAVVDINMNTFSNFNAAMPERPAILAKLPLASVTGQSSVKFGGLSWQPVSFSAADISSKALKTVATRDVVNGVATSLISTMDLKATVGGLGIDASGLTKSVGDVLTPLAPSLDKIVNEVTGLIGVNVGQADVRIEGVRCGKPTLVS